MAEAFGMGFGVFFLFIMVLSVGGAVFWVVALVECARYPEPVYRAAGSEKVTWVLVVALAGWIGALVYWFTVRSRLQDAERNGAAYDLWAPQPGHVPPRAGPAGPQTGYWLPRSIMAPGWYPDPEVGGHLRWWDGWRWTDHTAPG